jgi:uncharacterized protein DUF6677
MDNPVLIAIVSWFFPGAGHLIQKRFKRGVLIFAVVWTMFIVAIASGGAHYPGFDLKDGVLLYMLNVFGRLGNGLGAIVSYVLAGTPAPHAAALATFEYGGRFLEVSGLLNYLAAIDAVDIAVGRKK